MLIKSLLDIGMIIFKVAVILFARCLYFSTLCWLCLVEHMKVITSVCHTHGIFGSLCLRALRVCLSTFLSSDCIWPAQCLFFPLIGSCL